MEKNRKAKGLAVVAIILAVISLGVGFAAISTTLTINGTATVKASSWEVKFANLNAVELSGDAKELTAPTINTNDTSISTYDVSLITPGDSVTYTFDIQNNGTFDAKITSITIPTPQCTGSGDNASTDATNVCNNISYTLTYTDTGYSLAQGDVLEAQDSVNVTLTLMYSADILETELPTADVTLSNLGISILYSQE